MWEFYDRLVSLAIPRIRDFRGMNPNSFDGRGNYTFGVTEQLIFPEIDYDKIDTVRGHGHHHRHHRARPTTRAAHCCARSASRSAATTEPGVDRWPRRHSSRSSSAQPKFKVRGYTRCRRCGRAALGVPRLRAVPHLPARDGARRRGSRRDEGVVVRGADAQ